MREQGYGSMRGVGRLTRLAVLVVLAGLFVFSAGGAWADEVQITKVTDQTISIPVYSENDTLKISGDPLQDADWGVLKNLTQKFELVLNNETTDIPDQALQRNTAITGLTGNGVLTVGDMAFYDCTSLKTVTLPEATGIGVSAFQDCTSLETVMLPVAGTVGSSAFEACTSLETISLPKATGIGSKAFIDCEKLKTVSLPVAASIGNQAFEDCYYLSTLELSDEAPSLDVPVFNGACRFGPLVVWTEPDGVGNNYDNNAKDWATNTANITNGFYVNPTIEFNPTNPHITGTVGIAIAELTIGVTSQGGADISNISDFILPAGLKVSLSIGTDGTGEINIFDTPTAAGSGTAQVGVTNAAGYTASVDITYNIAAPADPGNNNGGGNNETPGGGATVPAYHKSPDITGFSVSIGGADYAATLQPDGTTWVIEVPYDTDLSSVTPDISLYPGAKLDPAPPYDFTSGPVTVTVTARDGTTTEEYTLIVGRAEPPAIPTNILDALPANATASVVPNADGTYGIEVRIPFDANFDPSEVEWIAIEAEGFSGLRVWYADAEGNETELALRAASRSAAARWLKISGTAPNRESAESAKIVKVTVKKQNDAVTYYQELNLKLSDLTGWSLPSEETGGDGSSSGGCDAGIPAGLILCGTMLLSGAKRKR